MGDIFKPIVDLAGGLLGETTSQYGAKNATNAATTNQNLASGSLNNAGSYYNALGNQGAKDIGTYNSNTPSILATYENAAGIPYSSSAVSGAATPNANPYSLTDAQQIQQNGQTDNISTQEQAAVSDFQARAAQQGYAPESIAQGIANIREQFGAQKTQTQASFAENARATRQSGAGNLLSYLQGVGQQGATETGNAASGNAGLGQVYQNQANTDTGLANQYTQQNNDALGGLAQLLTFGLTGGFSSPQTASAGITPQQQSNAPVQFTAPFNFSNANTAAGPYGSTGGDYSTDLWQHFFGGG